MVRARVWLDLYFRSIESKTSRKIFPHPVFEVDRFLEILIQKFSDFDSKTIEFSYGEFIANVFFWKNCESSHHSRTKKVFCRNLEKASEKFNLETLKLMAVLGSWSEPETECQLLSEIFDFIFLNGFQTVSRTRRDRGKK